MRDVTNFTIGTTLAWIWVQLNVGAPRLPLTTELRSCNRNAQKIYPAMDPLLGCTKLVRVSRCQNFLKIPNIVKAPLYRVGSPALLHEEPGNKQVSRLVFRVSIQNKQMT